AVFDPRSSAAAGSPQPELPWSMNASSGWNPDPFLLPGVPRQAGTADARIGQAVDERQALVPQRPFEGVPEVLGPLDPDPESAEGLSHGREVRVLQRRGRGPARVFAVLMAADRAVDRVVVDHDGDVETVLSRGGHLLTVHQEVTVAGDAEHGPFGVDESGGDRGRQTEAHRSV